MVAVNPPLHVAAGRVLLGVNMVPLFSPQVGHQMTLCGASTT